MTAARALGILFAGFCLVGADFSRSDLAGLVPGQTTEQQVRERFGDPMRQSTSTVGDKVVTSLHYSHAEPRSTLVPSRAMVLSFHEGTLVGFDFTSSFTTDDTSFDESTTRGIKRTVTTRAEVHRLVGPPTTREYKRLTVGLMAGLHPGGSSARIRASALRSLTRTPMDRP